MEPKFEHQTFGKRLKSMLKVDFRRMFTMPLIYIMIGVAFLMPVLILVMTTMMDGSVSVDPTTGVETVIEGFDTVWESIAATSDASSSTEMSLTGMCNINLIYFMAAVLVCIFVSDDFRSGYAKNLFTVRAKRGDYVVSKTLVGFAGGVLMIAAYFAGAMIGGIISGLSFDLGTASANGVVMCMIAKALLMAVFVAVFVLASVIGKQKLWQSMIGALMVSMLFFMMIPVLTPLDATIVNVVGCLAGGALFSVGLGAISNKILVTSRLV